MKWWWIGVSLYGLGFVFAFWLNMQLPVTFGLALLRSALWFIWLGSGMRLLRGEPLPMD